MATTKKTEPTKTIKVLTPAAQWVREVRATSRLSQPQFAKRLSEFNSPDEKPVSSVTVSRWENAIFDPDWKSADKIRKAFPAAPAAPARTASHSLKSGAVAALMDTMTKEERDSVLQFVLSVLAKRTALPTPTDGGDHTRRHGVTSQNNGHSQG